MATAQYVNELAQGTRVEGSYVLRTKEVRVARTGDAFLSLVLADRTGAIPGVLFRPSREAVDIPTGAVVTVRGTVTTFKGVRRVSVEQLLPASTWDPTSLIAVGSRSADELAEEFASLVRLVSDAGLRRLLRGIFGDKPFFARFSECPATLSGHHAHLGGLLEHTVTVASICAGLCKQYASLDRDLLLTSALVHDIGVVDALRYDTTITPTDEGRLVGHAVLGAFRIHEASTGNVGRNVPVLLRLKNAVLSHHAEGSSDERAMTLEALALQQADQADSRLAGFSDAVHGAVRANEPWTGDQNPFKRQLYAGSHGAGSDESDGLAQIPDRRLA